MKSTAIFVPVRLIKEDGKIFVVWACSLAENCDNLNCLYARRAHRADRGDTW